ncbi:hypothetical protein D1614_09645 [Maribellus luteus]|uniref:Uncharacterized protein n=1 Tax=Maribellus luteus TaxID=2305463 RepID=A0A399T193_9BACT|nr:hypothetical protein [Maribellus luteus]RIJ48779.1 hypothetical protein D1614_09645 [Maribellus luteus]
MEEKQLKEWMQESKLEIQLPDFDDNVMEAIHEKQAAEKSFWKNIRWSWFFFIVGLGLGLILTDLFASFEIKILGDKSNLAILGFEILVILILATQFDKLIRVTFRR